MNNLVAIVGPTATAKSRVAMAISQELGGEIISVDSMQVYRGMDIGTAKASGKDQQLVPHHMLDLVDPQDNFSVAEFQQQARKAVLSCRDRGVRAILVGGSGMHFRSVIDPMNFAPTDPTIRQELEQLSAKELSQLLLQADPEAGKIVDLANPRRTVRAVEAYRIDGRTPTSVAASQDSKDVKSYTPIQPIKIVGLDSDQGVTERISSRLGEMFALGLVAEVQGLVGQMGRTAAQAVGYKELIPVIQGKVNLKHGAEAIFRATTALVKRQRTYFRRDPRISWINCSQPFPDLYKEVVSLL